VKGAAAAVLAVLLLGAARSPAAEEPAPEAKEVFLETGEEGVKIAADLWEPGGGGEGKPAVLALHHEGGDRKAWAAVGRLLASHGVSLLAPDLRGHGGSRTLDGVDLGPRAEARDPELWKAMGPDVAAGLRWLRGTLLADGKRIGIAGAGAGAGLAIAAAEKDERVRAFYGVAPSPAACGLAGLASAARWNGRPAGFVVGRADEKGDSAPLGKELRKHPRTDIAVLPLEAKAPPGELLAQERAAAETAQFFLGWLARPALTGVPEQGVRRGGGIFVAGSSFGAGTSAGGLLFEGYFAPGSIAALVVLADPDPKAARLSAASRKVTVAPAGGKAPGLQVLVEAWSGSAWKKERSLVLLEAGGFVAEGKTTFYQVWLPPSVLGVAPFSKVAVTSAAVVDGEVKWGEEGAAGGPGRRRGPFTPSNPSAWQEWELR
jgi:dienelactone hydrolase